MTSSPHGSSAVLICSTGSGVGLCRRSKKGTVPMYDIYFWTTPNGYKILLFAEEAQLDYTIKPIHIGRGEQFSPEFLKISPNNRIPALVDHAPLDGNGPLPVFESGAILFYLAEKTGQFMPAD